MPRCVERLRAVRQWPESGLSTRMKVLYCSVQKSPGQPWTRSWAVRLRLVELQAWKWKRLPRGDTKSSWTGSPVLRLPEGMLL